MTATEPNERAHTLSLFKTSRRDGAGDLTVTRGCQLCEQGRGRALGSTDVQGSRWLVWRRRPSAG